MARPRDLRSAPVRQSREIHRRRIKRGRNDVKFAIDARRRQPVAPATVDKFQQMRRMKLIDSESLAANLSAKCVENTRCSDPFPPVSDLLDVLCRELYYSWRLSEYRDTILLIPLTLTNASNNRRCLSLIKEA